MNKKFFNEDGGGAVIVLAAILAYLVLASLFTAYFVTAMNLNYDVNEITPIGSNQVFSSEQNFASGTYNLETLARSGSSEWIFQSNIGLTLKKLSGDMSYLYIMNINSDSQHKITNNYIINNTPLQGYIVVLEGNSGNTNNAILVADTGFFLPYYSIDGSILGYNEFIPYNGANKIKDVTFKTEYTDGLKSCPLFQTCTITRAPYLKFTFNGQEFTSSNLNIGESDEGTQFYGGIAGQHTGLTISQFRTNNIIAGSGEQVDVLKATYDFLMTVISVLTWTLPPNLIPTAMQVVLIGIPEMVALVCVISIWRGVS